MPPLLTNGTEAPPATPSYPSHEGPIHGSHDENHDPAPNSPRTPLRRLAGAVSPYHNPSSSPAPPPDPETIVPPSPTNVTPTDALLPTSHLFNGHLSDRPSHRNANYQQPTIEQVLPHRRSTYKFPTSDYTIFSLRHKITDALNLYLQTNPATVLQH